MATPLTIHCLLRLAGSGKRLLAVAGHHLQVFVSVRQVLELCRARQGRRAINQWACISNALSSLIGRYKGGA